MPSLRIVGWLDPLFHDRADAGERLAGFLAAQPALEVLEDPLLVALARGGVAVAAPVAERLALPLTAVTVARLNGFGYRLGALTAWGPPYVAPGFDIPEEPLAAVVSHARAQAQAVAARLELAEPEVSGRDVVLVDDGLVTALTMLGAVSWARAAGARSVSACVPVAATKGLGRLEAEGVPVLCPEPLPGLEIVGQAYEMFDTLDEWYVKGLLDAH
jgi:putative phosphoribosyl transferase